ncbi:DNA-binding LacI/PurR family transcriptional regulator [Crossiella equi]|uniref:DNA-binding LacI/PurR family transcriptional regulator n=1 Tax=Crossiella equi TaxID=130796 RepID=A0ABS5A7P8_9PSEU|nr:substrate-binding domain-containing protein [Crossiella equi]MBP2471730.1 DNA-binding LacI/PurR family transcriptional regulator [Crossiella equi]
MRANEVRRQRILAAVRSKGSVRVSDLARELEVSVITVRRDVEELARGGELRRGHGVARALDGPASLMTDNPGPASAAGAVALVVPERHAYLHETMEGARAVLEAAGRRVVLHIAPQAPGTEQRIVDRVLAEDVCGLLIAPRWRTTEAEEADNAWLAAAGVPVVVMERRPRPGSVLHSVDSVCSDHWYGVHLALRHLVGLGHRRVVLAARDDSPTARALRGAFAEIAEATPSIEATSVLLSAVDAGPDASAPGPDLVGALTGIGATAAVLHGDVDALLLVQQLADDGIRVPEDVSVIAYDDVVAALGSTPLTAVAPPKGPVGRLAAELLLRRLGGDTGPVQRLELLPSLQVRGSTLAV